MSISDRLYSNPIERAKRGLKLPDGLTLGMIALLWATRMDESRHSMDVNDERKKLIKIMLEAIEHGCLKAEVEPHTAGLIPISEYRAIKIKRETFLHIHVKMCDFLAWLSMENEPRPAGVLLEKWWHEEQAEAPWLIPNPSHPPAEHDWWTPARYFAVQNKKDNSDYGIDKLWPLVQADLKKHEIYARGKKDAPPGEAAIKKALGNIPELKKNIKPR